MTPMNAVATTIARSRPTPLFVHYVIQLVIRFLLFAYAVFLYVTDPQQLDFTRRFGFADGFGFVDLCFVLMALDLISKLRPHAKIAMGSRKQYAEYHVPSAQMFKGGIRELREEARNLIDRALQGPSTLEHAAREALVAVQETARGVWEAGRQFAYSIDILRLLPWPEEDLNASERMRDRIRSDRMREIVPVTIFWVVFNVAVGLLLERWGLFTTQTAMLWAVFYFLFDMISVVLWCPLQLVLMRNRCCTTCQIFNWDGIMTVTPLIPVVSWFSEPLIVLALIVLFRWELAFARHPERFDERTNASLQCANCKDKLCFVRKPLTPRSRA